MEIKREAEIVDVRIADVLDNTYQLTQVDNDGGINDLQHCWALHLRLSPAGGGSCRRNQCWLGWDIGWRCRLHDRRRGGLRDRNATACGLAGFSFDGGFGYAGKRTRDCHPPAQR